VRVSFGLCRACPLGENGAVRVHRLGLAYEPKSHAELATELGLSRDRARRESEAALAALRKRFESLSPREREIMIEVARGRLSKQITGDIGIAEATVKVHRSRAMRKMNARSLPELGRMVDKLKLAPEKPQHF
jgi:FixJ family two-component response regulator